METKIEELRQYIQGGIEACDHLGGSCEISATKDKWILIFLSIEAAMVRMERNSCDPLTTDHDVLQERADRCLKAEAEFSAEVGRQKGK